MDSRLTLVELSRLETERQSLVFGEPLETIPCPNGRSLAAFMPDHIVGYERWRANDYGTVSWQLYILRTGKSGLVSRVPGVHPAAEILLRTRGKQATQRALNWIKALRRKGAGNLQSISELGWRRAANSRLLRRPFPAPESLLHQPEKS